MRFLPILTLALVWILALSSCDPAKKYEAEITSIDTALAQLDTMELSYAALPMDSVLQIYTKVKADMYMLQNKFQGEMDMEVGVNFSRYRDIPKNLKGLNEAKGGMEEAFAFSRKQLESLKEAILSGANRDANGNSINELYIKKNVETETKVVTELVQQMERMEKGTEKSFTDFEKYYPRVKPTLDSLRDQE